MTKPLSTTDQEETSTSKLLASLRDTATRFQVVSHHLGDDSPPGAAAAAPVGLDDCVQGWQL
jgi:hypothetical protein